MSTNSNKPSTLFWIIGVIALIWNGLGVDAYIQQAYQTERFKGMYTQDQLDMINSQPSWYTALFAIAVFGSAIATILLLLRKKLATFTFFIALIAVFLQTGYNLFINEAKAQYGAFEYSMLLMIPVFAIFLYLYSKKCGEKGYLS